MKAYARRYAEDPPRLKWLVITRISCRRERQDLFLKKTTDAETLREFVDLRTEVAKYDPKNECEVIGYVLDPHLYANHQTSIKAPKFKIEREGVTMESSSVKLAPSMRYLAVYRSIPYRQLQCYYMTCLQLFTSRVWDGSSADDWKKLAEEADPQTRTGKATTVRWATSYLYDTLSVLGKKTAQALSDALEVFKEPKNSMTGGLCLATTAQLMDANALARRLLLTRKDTMMAVAKVCAEQGDMQRLFMLLSFINVLHVFADGKESTTVQAPPPPSEELIRELGKTLGEADAAEKERKKLEQMTPEEAEDYKQRKELEKERNELENKLKRLQEGTLDEEEEPELDSFGSSDDTMEDFLRRQLRSVEAKLSSLRSKDRAREVQKLRQIDPLAASGYRFA